jgi:regulator of replication initiation timing
MTDLTRFTYLINQCLRFLWTREQQEEIQRLANEVVKENEQLRAENERLLSFRAGHGMASEANGPEEIAMLIIGLHGRAEAAEQDAERLAKSGQALVEGFAHYLTANGYGPSVQMVNCQNSMLHEIHEFEKRKASTP